MKIIAINHISLDGVIQSPARPEEDTRGGFRHGGWASAIDDPEMGEAMGRRVGADSEWLFGRVSYEDMLSYWNKTGGPFKDALNGKKKYVASSSGDLELPWPNSELLTGDVPREVVRLKESGDGTLVIMGSGALIQSLQPHRLIDELLLFVHPIVIGSGRRMFGNADDSVRFDLVDEGRTPGGVVIADFQLAE